MSDIIEHQGVVYSVEGCRVRVSIMQQSACSGCKARSMCTSSESKERVMEVFEQDAESKYAVGERVCVCGTLSMGKQAVAFAFGVPMLLTVVVMCLCLAVLHVSELAAVASWLVLMALYFLVLYAFRDKMEKQFALWIKKPI